MWLPWTKEQWKRRREILSEGSALGITEGETIQHNTDWLLERLYKPDPEIGAVFDRQYFPPAREEPINWGDLSCLEVKRFEDGSWEVILEEASPGDCPNLCEYVRSWLEKWGWKPVSVRTEW